MVAPTLPEHMVVIGASWGGVEACLQLLKNIPDAFPVPMLIVLHRNHDTHHSFERSVRRYCSIPVREVEDKEALSWPCVYLAPANYHLLMEKDGSFALCTSAPVHYCRPAIDVTMLSLSEVLGARLIGVLLTGANEDGALGLEMIKKVGGRTIVQDPQEAAAAVMPQAAITRGVADRVLRLKDIMPGLREYLGI